MVGVAAIVASGVIADRVGRRTILTITAGAIAAFSGFAPQLLNGGDIGEIVFMLLGFVLLGLSFGQCSAISATPVIDPPLNCTEPTMFSMLPLESSPLQPKT